MYARVTLLEIDTLRIDVDDAAELFRTQVLPALQEQEGYAGAAAFSTPEGKGMIVTLWDTEDAAEAALPIASGALERFVMLFRSPPGRDHYRVALLDLPGVLAATP